MTPEALIIENLLMIADKDGNDVPFKLNTAQQMLDNELAQRNLIPKARQEGISSYILGRALVKCLGERNMKAVIISHETEATQRMLQKIHYMISHWRGPEKPVTGSASKNEITFPRTGSMIYIGTAGSKKFGRGDTINFLHCSEIAYWENPRELTSGLLQAVPASGEVYMESTGNGQGNYYHRQCMRAQSGQGRFALHFFPWHTFPEYTVDLSPEDTEEVQQSLDEQWEEPELVEQYGLGMGQILWRRYKLEEMDFDVPRFKQEYPMTLDECFQASGRSVFVRVNYEPHQHWQKLDASLHGLRRHPHKDCSYLIGGDVSAGIGGDRSVAEIFCLENGEQVGEYVSDRISPDTFGERLADLGTIYNKAYINVENNNHGIMALKTLLNNYPSSLVYRIPSGASPRQDVDKITRYGFHTSVKSKPYAIGEFRRAAATWLKIHSPVLKSEMDSFVEKETGKLEAEEGTFDDTVMAAAMALVVWDLAVTYTAKAQYIPKGGEDPFSLEGIIDDVKGRQRDVFIPRQVH